LIIPCAGPKHAAATEDDRPLGAASRSTALAVGPLVHGDGLADFHLLRYRRRGGAVRLRAFDLIELDGRDLRDERIELRCKLGCEGIVSKRRGSRYARGRSSNWLKVKDPDAPAVRREPEEHWKVRICLAMESRCSRNCAAHCLQADCHIDNVRFPKTTDG
jgi:hypothetical protein